MINSQIIDIETNLEAFSKGVFEYYAREQIVLSGEEYNLLCKDPAVNAKMPYAFIYPQTTEQVQILVNLASQYKVKLWTYSTGKNWGYLNTSNSEDSVVVLLTKMNKIIQVDHELAYAIIEPGVTYEALNRYLKENNLKLWTDSPGGPPTGSVIGNALDRGVGVTKYGDHYAHLCGYEVVLADGTVIHTGIGNKKAGDGAAHLYKWGVGPYIEGLFSQSNYGIVTKAGIWLMREPKDYALVSMNIKDDESLVKCLNTTRELMLSGIIQETGRFSNSVAIMTLITQAINEGLDLNKAITKEQLEEAKKKYCVPGWTGSFGIYGQNPMVKSACQLAKKELKKSGGCSQVNIYSKERSKLVRKLVAFIENTKSKIMLNTIDFILRKTINSSISLVRLFPGLMNLHEGTPGETCVRRGYFRYYKDRPKENIHIGRDNVGVLWSVPVLPFRGDELVSFAKECEVLFKKYNFDFYMTTMIFNARSVCPLMVILYDRKNEIECKRAEALYLATLDLSLKKGYQHFRAGINGWGKMYQHAPELKELNQKIKAALDPEGIFAPGRYGID